MLRKIGCLIPAQLCFILHHLSWWKLLFAVGNFQVILKPWHTDALYTHSSLLCWLRLSTVCMCVCVFLSLCVCGAGDGGEDPAFWYIPVKWREYLSGRSWTAWDHKDTYKLSKRERRSFWVQPSSLKTHTERKFGAPLPAGEGMRRGRGQRHLMVLSSQEPGQIQTHSTQPNPWRCVSHTRAHTPTVTGNPGATRVLS